MKRKNKLQFIQDTIEGLDDLTVLEGHGIIKSVKVFDELSYNKDNCDNGIYIVQTPDFGPQVFTYYKTWSYDGDIDVIGLISIDGRESRYTENYEIFKWMK